MARISYGALATSINGAIGGTVFQNNRFGFSAKNKGSLIRPNSASQNKTKKFLRTAVQAWRQLTDAERADWINYALTYPQGSKHNPLVYISGYTLFCMWHLQYFIFNDWDGNIQDEVYLGLPEVPAYNFTLSSPGGGDLFITPNWSFTSGEWFLNYYFTGPLSKTINFVGSRYRFVSGGDTFTPSFDIGDAYAAVYGKLPVPGEKVGVRVVIFRSGGGRVMPAIPLILTVIA